jgi:ComF family protein
MASSGSGVTPNAWKFPHSPPPRNYRSFCKHSVRKARIRRNALAARLHRRPAMLFAAANDVVRMLLAPVCVGCAGVLRRPLAGPVCEDCWLAVAGITPPWCWRCGDALAVAHDSAALCQHCRHTPPPFALARSAGRYDGSLRHIIHAFKYQRRRVIAVRLAALMRRAGVEALDGADAVIPVPLHPWRALQRGFNQADDLCVHLGPPVWRVLRRRRYGPPQAGLTAARRRSNVRGAFAVRTGRILGLLGPAWSRRLRHRTVVLVDDVMTTGTTLEACAEVLLGAGVRSVRVLTVARAAAARPPVPPEPHRLSSGQRQ